MKRAVLAVVLVAIIITFNGCAKYEPKDLSGQTLPAVGREQVKLYQKKPEVYDIVGMISVPISPDMKWDDKGYSEKAFEKLIERAAAMGANGVLLDLADSEYDVLAGAGYQGAFYQVPIRLKPSHTLVARAIQVKEKS